MAEQLEHADAEAAVNELQRKLERLRVLYEQYFIGITKREPSVPLKDVVRLVHMLDQQKIRNTGLRFRLRTLIQKFQVYRTYWARTLRAIDAGTYKRDVARVKRKYARQGVEMPELGKMRTAAEVEKAMSEAATEAKTKRKPSGKLKKRPLASDIRGKPAEAIRQQVEGTPPDVGAKSDPLISQDDAEAALDALFGGDAPSEPPPPPPAAGKPPLTTGPPARVPTGPPARTAAAPPRPTPPSRPARPSGAGLGDDGIDSLYRRMVKAKKMVGEKADSITREGLARTVSKQLPKLREMHPGKEIDFQVVIRKGKVVLKAKPKG